MATPVLPGTTSATKGDAKKDLKGVHKNSRKVYIRRKTSFAEGAQTGAADFMSQSKKSIGSYWEKGGSQGVGSGLTFEEKDILMPYLVALPKDDREFQKKVQTFFEGIATKIPYGEEGLVLEIGMTISNDEPVTFFEKDGDKRIYNIPINILDYVRWRHAYEHPFVAHSEREATGNQLIQYYIYDPVDAVQDRVDVSREGDEALTSYLKIKDDEQKVWSMLVLLDIDPRLYSGPKAKEERAVRLREEAAAAPRKFNEVYDDKMFEQKYLLQGMINAGIIKRVGAQYIFAETSKILGHTEEEALLYFIDPKNSDTVVMMKAQLQEANKQTVKKPNRQSRTPVGR